MTRAIVVFLGADLVYGAAWYARLLKPGFVHCFVLLESPAGWIKIEGINGIVKLSLLLGEFNDVIAYYRAQGATIMETTVRDGSSSWAPLIIGSCVGTIKSVINSSSWALTPFGLYRYLLRGSI